MRCPGVCAMFANGEEIEVDFVAAHLRNLTRGTDAHFTPLADHLIDMIRAGGWQAMFRRRWARPILKQRSLAPAPIEFEA